MTDLLRKLQYKEGQRIYVRGVPPEFREQLDGMKSLAAVSTSPTCKKPAGLAIYFVKSQADIARFAAQATSKVEDDGVLWFAYPKKSSKRYDSDIARDAGWQPLGDAGFEGVRQIAIDDDWSALRLRRVENIRTMKRDSGRAMSARGKSRTR